MTHACVMAYKYNDTCHIMMHNSVMVIARLCTKMPFPGVLVCMLVTGELVLVEQQRPIKNLAHSPHPNI